MSLEINLGNSVEDKLVRQGGVNCPRYAKDPKPESSTISLFPRSFLIASVYLEPKL